LTCTHALIIHKDGRCFCSEPSCVEGGVIEAVLRHRIVVTCRSVFDWHCPACDYDAGRPEVDDIYPTSTAVANQAEISSLCPGTAIVHEDGSVECSESGCSAKATVGEWLAVHSIVRSCRALRDTCAICSDFNLDRRV